MHDTGCLGLVHWDNPEGWYREGGGGRVQDGEHASLKIAQMLLFMVIYMIYLKIYIYIYLKIL